MTVERRSLRGTGHLSIIVRFAASAWLIVPILALFLGGCSTGGVGTASAPSTSASAATTGTSAPASTSVTTSTTEESAIADAPIAPPATGTTQGQSSATTLAAASAPQAISTTTTTASPATLPELSRGAKGPAVALLQQKLAALSYQPGRTDGVFDRETGQAVIAFQKVEGLSRDGVVGPQTWAMLLVAPAPTPRLTAPGTRVEVDLTRQVLFYIENNQVTKTLACSTGKAGWRTPPGHYRVYRKIPAWHQSTLGMLYRPCYIVGGIAIHGEGSVPAYPGSHGCIRVTVTEMNSLYAQLPIGLRVDVYR